MPQVTLRHIASFLGLPPDTHVEEANTNAAVVNKAAQFLAHSDIGNGMSLTQRTRLAAQCFIQEYAPGSVIAHAQDPSTDLYIVQEGTIEVWSDPETMAHLGEARLLAQLVPGQITGELALLDGGRRSADLRAGEEGATVMKLYRDRILALCEDSPPLCTRLIWNIATALALRLRLTNWQLQLIADEIEQREAMQEAAEEQPDMIGQAH
jgi:CRP-like cAMP-binding protein